MKRDPLAAGVAAVLVFSLLVLIAGCGATQESGQGGPAGGGGETGARDEDMAMVDDAQPGGEADQGTDAAASSPEAVGSGTALPASGDFGRKIVKSADLGIRAGDVRGVAAEVQRVATQSGGNLLQSQISGSGETVSAYMVLSVPAEEFEGALVELRGLGRNVVQDTVSGQDVTEEYVDLESRERNLLAAERSLLELYGRAETVEDTLTIERELTNIRGQIEEVQGRLQYLDDRTAFSQISVSITPVVAPKPEPPQGPLAVAASAWALSLDVLRAIATVGIAVAAFSWWLVPFPVVAYVLWRRRRTPSATPTGG